MSLNIGVTRAYDDDIGLQFIGQFCHLIADVAAADMYLHLIFFNREFVNELGKLFFRIFN